jgi:peptidoglycan hydrolase CwlO-like protein
MSAQGFISITVDEPLISSLPVLMKNDEAAVSNNAGSSFPTSNLLEGMTCYRTDESCLYQLTKQSGEWVWKKLAMADDVESVQSDVQSAKTDIQSAQADIESIQKEIDDAYALLIEE